jgi:hypothetical protein
MAAVGDGDGAVGDEAKLAQAGAALGPAGQGEQLAGRVDEQVAGNSAHGR